MKTITEKEVLGTPFLKAKKRTWIWCDDYYSPLINPEYSYFNRCTLHIPTEIWRKGKNSDISNKMCKIILHRSYNIQDPSKYWDWSFENNESEVVYKGFVYNKEHLEKLIKDLGIIDDEE